MDRFFVSADTWSDGCVRLGAEESHHCLRVMRKRKGEPVEVFDGAGRRARGVIAGEHAGAVEVTIETVSLEEPDHPVIQLVVAVAKGKAMDLVVQKAVELGVNSIQPVLTERTVVRVEANDEERKEQKWQRVALEACKQCGQNFVPRVRPVAQWEEWIGNWRGGRRMGLLASPSADTMTLKEALARLPENPERIDWVIGPEGGFSDAEIESAAGAGLQRVSLGLLTLRVETAVLYGLSVLSYELR